MPEADEIRRIGARLPKPWLVICDLDGTLLDHADYSHAAAAPQLEALEAHGIPVILNTSKTFAEVLSLRVRLGNRHPFIVENGAAIYLPEGYFPDTPADAESREDHLRLLLGSPRQRLLDWLEEQRAETPGDFQGFAQMSEQEIADATGLDLPAARLAAKREFSEPLRWLGSESAKAEFCRRAAAGGFRTFQGGRFLHVLGDCDKGRASLRLAREYRVQGQPPASLIAAGDSGNDVAMLAIADLAVVVRSPAHDFPAVPAELDCVYTEASGPEGWAHTMKALLDGSATKTTQE